MCTSWYIIIINNTEDIIPAEVVHVTNFSVAVTWLRSFSEATLVWTNGESIPCYFTVLLYNAVIKLCCFPFLNEKDKIE